MSRPPNINPRNQTERTHASLHFGLQHVFCWNTKKNALKQNLWNHVLNNLDASRPSPKETARAILDMRRNGGLTRAEKGKSGSMRDHTQTHRDTGRHTYTHTRTHRDTETRTHTQSQSVSWSGQNNVRASLSLQTTERLLHHGFITKAK